MSFIQWWKQFLFAGLRCSLGEDGGGEDGGGDEGGEDGSGDGSRGGNDDGGAAGDGNDADGASDSSTKGAWPDDWRTQISADEKHQKTLSRFASPKALYESYTALRQKLDSGEVKAQVPFPEKGTDKEKDAWRKAHGLPEKAEGYKDHIKDLVSEEDEAFLGDFLSHAHASNLNPKDVKNVLSWYKDFNIRTQQAMQEQDAELLHSTEDALRTEWGGDYRRNVNMIKGLLEGLPAEVQPLFVGARLSNGQAMLNNPEVARWLLGTALTVNPVGTVVPGAGANLVSAIEDEIGTIEKVMREDRPRYNRDEKMQTRLRELYSAKERAKK